MSRKTLSVWVEPHGEIFISFWSKETNETILYKRPMAYLHKLGWILDRMNSTYKYIARPFFAGVIGIVLELNSSKEAK